MGHGGNHWLRDFHNDAEKSASVYSVELNLRDRVLGEVEKNSFIALPGKGGHRGLLPWKTVSQPVGIW